MSMKEQIKRVWMDILLSVILLVIYVSGAYLHLPAPAQLIFVKMLLVSLGFLHAHITRKLCFPVIDWSGGVNANAVMAISLYVIFVYAYSTGG